MAELTEELFTTAEVAAMCRASTKTVLRARKRKGIAVQSVDRPYLWTREDIRRLRTPDPAPTPDAPKG